MHYRPNLTSSGLPNWTAHMNIVWLVIFIRVFFFAFFTSWKLIVKIQPWNFVAHGKRMHSVLQYIELSSHSNSSRNLSTNESLTAIAQNFWNLDSAPLHKNLYPGKSESVWWVLLALGIVYRCWWVNSRWTQLWNFCLQILFANFTFTMVVYMTI